MKTKPWSVVIQLVDSKGGVHREDRYEVNNAHNASELAFQLCSNAFESEDVITVNGDKR